VVLILFSLRKIVEKTFNGLVAVLVQAKVKELSDSKYLSYLIDALSDIIFEDDNKEAS
jgi:hypothetical protein